MEKNENGDVNRGETEPEFRLDDEAKRRIIELLRIEAPELSTEQGDVLWAKNQFELPTLSVPLAKIEKACRVFRSESVLEPLTKSESESLVSIKNHSEDLLTALDSLPVDAFVALDCRLEHSNEIIRELIADLREAASASELGRVEPPASSRDFAGQMFVERLVDTFAKHCGLENWFNPPETWPTGRNIGLCEFLTYCVGLVGWERTEPVESTNFYEGFVAPAIDHAIRRRPTRSPQPAYAWESSKPQKSDSKRDDVRDDDCNKSEEPAQVWRVTIFYCEPTYDIRHNHEGRVFRDVTEIEAVHADAAARLARLRFSRFPTTSQVSWVREITRITVEPAGNEGPE